jgi:hypothetical protein
MKYKNAFIIPLLIVIGACSGGFDTEKSEQAVKRFHEHLNNSDFNAIYDSASEGFRESDEKENLIRFFRAVREKLGAYGSTELQGWKVNHGISGKVVTLTYDTKYEKGKAREVFTVFETDEGGEIHNYNVNSTVFILD